MLLFVSQSTVQSGIGYQPAESAPQKFDEVFSQVTLLEVTTQKMAYREVLHSSSDDDSSSSDEVCWKRKKSDVHLSPVKDDSNVNIPQKRTKRCPNNIWLNVIDEFKLRDSLSMSHLHEKRDTSRGVESYLVDTDETDERLNTKKLSSQPELPARLLNEPNQDLIRRTVDILGVQRALEFYYLTEDIENSGGLYLMDGSRRRSPGGVYLNLIKNSYSVTKAEKVCIFLIDRQVKEKLKRIRRYTNRMLNRKNVEVSHEIQQSVTEPPESDCLPLLDINNSEEPVILEGESSQLSSPIITMNTIPVSPCQKSHDPDESMEEGELPPSDDDM
ncbi:unnamed protein product [Heterobilharzia americana]|nr:unnamed protein product [Heterobilharzia americana]